MSLNIQMDRKSLYFANIRLLHLCKDHITKTWKFDCDHLDVMRYYDTAANKQFKCTICFELEIYIHKRGRVHNDIKHLIGTR